jgi:hypothetical protein
VQWKSRAHFFAIAAQLMRRILVDYARTRARAKRGGGALRISLNEAAVSSEERAAELISLDDALQSSRPLISGRAKWWNCGSLAG